MIEELPKDDLFKDIPLIDLQEKLFECKKMAENKWTDQALIGSAVHDWIEGYLKIIWQSKGIIKDMMNEQTILESYNILCMNI